MKTENLTVKFTEAPRIASLAARFFPGNNPGDAGIVKYDF
jgi:hypothetical protein